MANEMNWISVDVDSLPANVKQKYAALKKAQSAAAEAKAEFEAAFIASAKKMERIPEDVNLAFGYRFGKLAIAKVDAEAKPKAKKPMFQF